MPLLLLLVIRGRDRLSVVVIDSSTNEPTEEVGDGFGREIGVLSDGTGSELEFAVSCGTILLLLCVFKD